jgi:hypothetical protein
VKRPTQPGALTLGFGDVHVQVQPMPGDPYTLRVDTKLTANLDCCITRAYTRAGTSNVRETLPNVPQLWLGNIIVNLQPEHIERTRAWCAAYEAWLRDGDLEPHSLQAEVRA